MPVVYVTADVAGQLESPVYAILKLGPQIDRMVLPEGYSLAQHTASQPFRTDRYEMKWDGEWQITYEVFRDLGLAFAAVLVLIYILNVAWFQSFKTPLIIMSAIPFSLIGILPAHGGLGAFFTATSMIGFIAGAGIVVRNSIILVDFIEQKLAEGVPLDQAVVDAGAVRFRPDGSDRGRGRGRRVRDPVRSDLPGPGHLADGRRGRVAAAVAHDRAGRVLRHAAARAAPVGPGDRGQVGGPAPPGFVGAAPWVILALVAPSGTNDPPNRDAGADPAGASGSIDVQISGADLPVAADPAAGAPAEAHPHHAGLSGRVAESLSHLPLVPKTRKSRVVARSLIVGLLLVAAWIGGIVYWQWRGERKPDFRPQAEKILVELRDHDYEKVYRDASPRFQELVLLEAFEHEMSEMNATLGTFREISSVTETEIVRGPSGKSARVGLLVVFDPTGTARGNMSFHLEDNHTWHLLGISIELPADVATRATKEEDRLKRVQGPPELEQLAVDLVKQLDQGEFQQVYDAAADTFRASTSPSNLAELERKRQKEIGKFSRIVNVTSLKQSPTGESANLDALFEYEGATKTVISVHFGFVKDRTTRQWRLAEYKPIMPAPRASGP